ncbi:hypothetical protein CGRA01v4_02609 [Colletotrichum graminicola]|nr:hypothetical protein CGRA01v4_02609 [Colletotrichum graminicola]
MHTRHRTARPQSHTNASFTTIVYRCPLPANDHP